MKNCDFRELFLKKGPFSFEIISVYKYFFQIFMEDNGESSRALAASYIPAFPSLAFVQSTLTFM